MCRLLELRPVKQELASQSDDRLALQHSLPGGRNSSRCTHMFNNISQTCALRQIDDAKCAARHLTQSAAATQTAGGHANLGASVLLSNMHSARLDLQYSGEEALTSPHAPDDCLCHTTCCSPRDFTRRSAMPLALACNKLSARSTRSVAAQRGGCRCVAMPFARRRASPSMLWPRSAGPP